HFGSASFQANKVDYRQTMAANWTRFAAKWGYSTEFPVNGYNPRQAFKRGFDASRHRAAVERRTFSEPSVEALPLGVDTVFYIAVRGERDWTATAEFVKRFARSFKLADGAMLAIGAFGEEAAETLAGRVERAFKRLGVEPEYSGHVEISDEDDEGTWLARFANVRSFGVMSLEDRSPSALRRLVQRK
ncbi:MAG TPA: hypothetical protein VKR05_01675, partial [Candidatus Cybelea sp.]|nr:hypothetical protein [Candidatus Cybelea sp.]